MRHGHGYYIKNRNYNNRSNYNRPNGSNYNYYNNNENNYKKGNYYYNNDSRFYNDNNSKNKSSKFNSKYLTIDNAILTASYPEYLQDFIKNFIITNYSNNRGVKIYLTSVNNENLFIIEYKLSINFDQKFYHIYVLVYLPTLYPNYPPEFYISKRGKVGINDYYKNNKIDPGNFKINIDEFVSFDAEKNNVEEIIDKLKNEFNREFPIYKLNENDYEPEPKGKCILDLRNISEIILENKNYNDDNWGEFEDKKIINNNNNINSINFDIKEDFKDDTFMNYIKMQVKDVLKEKYLIFKEKFKFDKNYNTLKYYENSMNLNLDKDNTNINENPLKKELDKLQEIKNVLNSIEEELKKENQDIKNRNKNKSIFEKCDELIKIKDKKDFELIIMRKTLEDYLIYLKKGYEKKAVSFEDMINQTRMISREIFNIDYVRKKLKNY